MPLIAYTCKCGYSESKFMRQAKDAPASFECPKCGDILKKSLSGPSLSSKVIVDNGFQARAVEVSPDIVELNEQRSEKDYHKDE